MSSWSTGRGNAFVNQAGFRPDGSAPNRRTATIAVVTPDGSFLLARSLMVCGSRTVWPSRLTFDVDRGRVLSQRLTAFDIDDDGGLSNRRIWADLGKDAPDGICLDAEGAVWYADVPNRHCVRVPAAARTATVALDRGCFSCALGGSERRTLFIVATKWNGPEKYFQGERTGQVVAIDVAVPHAGLTL